MQSKQRIISSEDRRLVLLQHSLLFFQKWYTELYESGDDVDSKYLTWQTDFDLRCLVHGTIGLTQYFMERNPSNYLVLHRLTQVILC